MTFAVAARRHAALAARHVRVRRSWAPCRRAPPAPPSRSSPSCRSAIPLPTDGRAGVRRFVQGNVPQAGPGVQRPAPRRAGQPRRRHRAARRRARPTTSPSSCGPRTPPTSTRSATRTPRRRSTTPARPWGCRCSSARCSPSRPGYSSNVSLFYLPGVAEPQRYVKLHPVPFAEYIPGRAFFRMFTPMADLAGNFVAGDEIGVFRVPAASGRLRGAADDLLRGRLRRPDARQRRALPGDDQSLLVVQTNNATFGYTAESEQQFAISPDPGHRARPVGRARLDRRGVRVRRPRRLGHREDRAVHGRPARCRPRGPHRADPGRPARRRPGVVAAAALLLLVVGSTRAARSVRVHEHRPTERPRTDTVDLRPPDRRCGASPSSSRRTTSGTPCP